MRRNLLTGLNCQIPTPNSQAGVGGSSFFGSWKLGVGSSSAASPACRVIAIVAMSVALVACRQDMHDAPRYEPLEESAFFASGGSARTLVPNTVPRGYLREDELLYTGKVSGQFANVFPSPVTAAVMARGQERFNVFCSPCHGRTGVGNGMPQAKLVDGYQPLMPTFQGLVSEENVIALVEYVKSLRAQGNAVSRAEAPEEPAKPTAPQENR